MTPSLRTRQAQERLPRAELQVQLDGLQQQQCDALRSWCTPLFRQAREVLDRALGNPRELKAAENKIFAPFVSAATESGVKVGGADVIFGGTNQGPGVLSLEAQSVAQDKGAENVVQELIDSKEAREADRVLPPTLQKRRDTLQQTVTTRQGSFLQAYGALRAIDYFLELAVLSGTAGAQTHPSDHGRWHGSGSYHSRLDAWQASPRPRWRSASLRLPSGSTRKPRAPLCMPLPRRATRRPREQTVLQPLPARRLLERRFRSVPQRVQPCRRSLSRA